MILPSINQRNVKMKKSVWLIIFAGILFCLSVGLTVLGVYRIIYIVKTDPFEDIVKYILKVFGLVGIIFLQIAGYGGAITLLVFGIIFTAKKDKPEPKRVVEQPATIEVKEEPTNDSAFAYSELKFEGDKLLVRNLSIDMKEIKNVHMNRNEVLIKLENIEHLVVCKDTSEAVSLVSKIKQYSK